MLHSCILAWLWSRVFVYQKAPFLSFYKYLGQIFLLLSKDKKSFGQLALFAIFRLWGQCYKTFWYKFISLDPSLMFLTKTRSYPIVAPFCAPPLEGFPKFRDKYKTWEKINVWQWETSWLIIKKTKKLCNNGPWPSSEANNVITLLMLWFTNVCNSLDCLWKACTT